MRRTFRSFRTIRPFARAARNAVESLEPRRLLAGQLLDFGDVRDFGDAPDDPLGLFKYPTIFGGFSGAPANHGVVPVGPKLGPLIDPEADGQPNLPATGDDLSIVFAGVDDEDGVTVGGVALELVSFTPGSIVPVAIANPGTPGLLNAWFDWSQDGDWADPGEQVAFDVPILAGVTALPVPVPATLLPTTVVYARFRLSTIAGLSPMGPAPDGEVEDYRVKIEDDSDLPRDFGDAPDFVGSAFAYPTVFGGVTGSPANHFLLPGGPVLGPSVDPEPDGQPDIPATGDDLSILFGGFDDENGITVSGAPLETVPLAPGGSITLTITNSGAPALLNAWFDWAQDGDWLDAGEQVAFDVPIPTGAILFPVPVPAGLVPTTFVYSRFRLSTAAGLSPAGPASDGEVEDYRQRVGPPVTTALDFGDAPDDPAGAGGYPTSFAAGSPDPARHSLVAGAPVLGLLVDPEPDGQPNAPASGDDINLLFPGVDDEDGVSVAGMPLEMLAIAAGAIFPVDIANSGGAGLVSAWFDWDRSFTFDPGEQVIIDAPAPAGITSLPVPVPAGVTPGFIYSRFRITTVAGLGAAGLAPTGEVEDYRFRVIDGTPPSVVTGALEFETRQAITLTFSEPLLAASVSATDLLALNTDDGTTPVATSVILSGGGTVATWVFNTPGTYITDGDYSFDLPLFSVSDLAGNGLVPAFNLSGPGIFFNAGDTNRDRIVDIGDFAALAANFNAPGTFSDGNFDYIGLIDISDFAILASKFNQILPRNAPAGSGDSSQSLGFRSVRGSFFGEQPITVARVLEESELGLFE